MKPSRETDVLVIGGGPVGLFAALSLAERGVRVTIAEKEWTGSAHSYALALHSSSLAMLEEAGLAAELIEQGHRVDTIGFYRGKERLGELQLSQLGGRHPYVLVLPQSALERALESRLKSDQVKVLWNHQIMALEAGADDVTVEIAKMDKVSLGYPVARTEWVIAKKFHTRASFVVGADGYHSFTRRALGVRYEDLGGAQNFSVFEFQSSADLGREVRLVLHEGTTNVLWPMKDKRGRFSFQVDGGDARPTPEALQSLVRERAPWFDAVAEDVYWSTTTRFERRLADRFGRGRVWLAGDAAHITGPAGVQSMNVGLREANEIAERMSGILSEGAPLGTLETYSAGRLREWRTLLGAGGGPVAGKDAPAWAAEQGAQILPCLPASGGDLGKLMGQIGLRIDAK